MQDIERVRWAIFEGVVTCYVDALRSVGNSATNFGQIFVVIVQYKTAGEMLRDATTKQGARLC